MKSFDPTRHWPAFAVAFSLAAGLPVLSGCAEQEPSSDAPRPALGTVEFALLAQGESGVTYRLRRADVEFEGPESRTVSLNGNDVLIRVELEPGTYQATLFDGWQMQRRRIDETFETVHAALKTPQPQTLDVEEGEVTRLVLRFDVGEDAVTFGKGGVHVEVDIHELDSADGGSPSAECGNAIIEGGEQCDDGMNSGDYEGCAPGCVVGPRCGDGVVQPTYETCDDGNSVEGDGCSNDCSNTAECGNGIVEPGEWCDDGNLVDGDGCSSMCTLDMDDSTVCGDGILDSGEECDDGNFDDEDSCLSFCLWNQCGDGWTYTNQTNSESPHPLEECDDGNPLNGDGCNNDCTLGFCGDGVVDPNEYCDDGNDVQGDGCNDDCQAPYCGNGILDPGEECDDGNDDSTDGCTTWCALGCPVEPPDFETTPWCDTTTATMACDYDDQVCQCDECGLWRCEPKCGNGVVDPGEACDDGNLDPCDGCLPSCEAFTPPAPGGVTVAPTVFDTDTVWCGDVDVDANLVVLQDATLFVGPGTVRFGSNVTLQVRGDVRVGGNAATAAVLTSAVPAPAPGDWFGVDIRRDLGATGQVEHAIFEYAERALSGLDEHGALRDSVFRDNVAGLVDVDATPTYWCESRQRELTIERVQFLGNETGALPDGPQAFATFDSCQFSDNVRGIHYASDVDVIASQFLNNEYGIDELYSSGKLEDSVFVNNDYGISRLYYVDAQRNLIADNATAGIGFVYYGASLVDNTIVRNGSGISFDSTSGAFTILGNTLCDNGSFDLISNTLSSIIAEDNYWCTTDSAAIADRISDVFDGNPDAGPVFYEPFLSAPSPNAPVYPGP